MEPTRRSTLLFAVGVLWTCAFGLQRPPPRYSQQYMPETSFSCRNKIVGSYYADPETDCQVFHVCVSVAGSVQDYKFLCPNDTAFDQESQTCADWYDVDCEAATLYYASDNFDLYRIGSGLESPHYDSIRTDLEPQDHLQRSETSDPVRSSANTLNRVSSTQYNVNNNRDILRGSGSGNFYNSKNGKEEDYENEKYREEATPEVKKKTGVRKVSRKQQLGGNNNDYSPSSTPLSTNNQNGNYNGNYYGNNDYNQRSTGAVPSTTARSQDTYGRGQNSQRHASTTYRPNTSYQESYSNYQSPSTTVKSTAYNAYNPNYNQQSSGTFSQSTTVRPSTYNGKNGYQNYANVGQYSQSSTVQPSTNYQANDYTNYQQRSYNNIQRSNSGGVAYQSSTASTTVYENTYGNGNGQYRSSTRQESSPTTVKYYPSYSPSSYAPTTYSPATKKYVAVESGQVQAASRTNEGQYYEKTGQAVKSSTQYYDSTKAPKKITQYNNYDGTNGGKYYSESSTGNYDLARASSGIGFSPASINHLAETPRSTTPVPRRASSVTTYNPNGYNSNTQRPAQSPTTARGSAYVSGSARPFTSTTKFPSSTTARPKSGKKNDYDYAYYDNAGGLEYDGLDLEHVTGNKESSKIARN
ncbi:hypothetical protein KM043_007209 [Ampulex compressa]|nr:hypothetical protein KM043_007209 [Ampulex compressa]